MKWWWAILIPAIALGMSGCWDFEEQGWSDWNLTEPTLQGADDAMNPPKEF